MKKIILSLLISTLFVSCQEELNNDFANENIFKKHTGQKLNFENNGGGENTQTRESTTQQVPFDFGISAVLGAGALAAIKMARKRRKEEMAG
jgi:hypothetical protein